jgi:hypothetical protein
MARDWRVQPSRVHYLKKGPTTMAQTPRPEETSDTGETATPDTGRPQGLFGSSTTILLLVFAVAVFWWSRRRRVAMEEQLRAHRREAEATAERSAFDVANLMRAAPQPGAGAAAAREGLASAAPMPAARASDSTIGDIENARTTIDGDNSDLSQTAPGGGQDEARALELERAEARAAAERAAEEQAERALRASQNAGESVTRRMAAASSAADEAAADTADAAQAGLSGANLEADDLSAGKAADSQQMTSEVRRRADLPAGAVAGDGTANCPPGYPIKGNRQSRIYHRPGQVSYPSTIAEYCFASEAAAELAGFRQSRARGQRTES